MLRDGAFLEFRSAVQENAGFYRVSRFGESRWVCDKLCTGLGEPPSREGGCRVESSAAQRALSDVYRQSESQLYPRPYGTGLT